MRVFKVIMAILVAGVIAIPAVSCASNSNSAAENQVATVQRGNLTIDIAASGNLALSRTDDLAFEMAGTVQEVLVKEGDSITQGQVLASLDTSDWDKQLKTLQKQLVTTQRNLTSAERQIGAKELAVRQAELNLQTAEDNVEQIADVKAVQDQIDAAEQSLKTAQMMLVQGGGPLGTFYWSSLIVTIQENLAQLRQNLKGILSGTSVSLSSDVALQVAKSQLQVEQSRRALEDARLAVEDAQLAKEDAEQAVEDAQSALDEAKSLSPIIKATFAGFVTQVNVKGGDEVKKGTVAVQIADPDKFESNILVSEMDIPQVKVGGTAVVEVDTMSGLSLSANVTHISPTATIQQGVVNYKVTVEVQSLETTLQERQPARANIPSDNISSGGQPPTTPQITPGELPDRLKQAVAAGQMTQEQAENIMKQMQERQGTQPVTVPTATTENFQLRQGMTVTVSIIVQQASNVLLVPNTAITQQGTKSVVKVSKDGAIEEREVKTGISDSQYTEVTEGLSEGEKVVIPKTTSTTSTTTQQRGQGGGIMPIFR